jgi:hypothetical protein
MPDIRRIPAVRPKQIGGYRATAAASDHHAARPEFQGASEPTMRFRADGQFEVAKPRRIANSVLPVRLAWRNCAGAAVQET